MSEKDNVLYRGILDLGMKDVINTMPISFVTLTDALRGARRVTLNNGETQELKEDDVKKLAEVVPRYLHSIVELPLIVIKTAEPGQYTIRKFLYVNEVINAIFHQYSDILNESQVSYLIREYPSLTFVVIDVSSIFRGITDNNWL
ncbi:hypothetical protein HS7_20130 [Sulfolobales archaeon HS-7]|nr:hypothetical protein HS7_20130 [Sulfolobales archaeon HS-7]